MLKDFLKYQAKTTSSPMGLEIANASGNYLYDVDGKSYLDFVAGVSACPLGHSHPKIIKAIAKDTNIKTGVLDPLGADLKNNKNLYLKLLKNLSSSLRKC